MELYQLRTFVTVAREGHLTRAAERLFTSQPAVSAHIKALEEEFGFKLFERTSTGMVPTPAGETLWEEAERVLNSATDLAARADALKGRASGTLRLGLNNDVGVLRGADMITTLAEAHPGLQFRLVYGPSGALLEAVESRELDAIFYEGALDDPAIQQLPLTDFELVVAMPLAWAAELAAPDWHTLESRPWILGTPHCSFSNHAQQIARERGLQLQRRFQVDDDATTLSLVAAGLALAMTTRATLQALPELAARVAVWPHFARKLPLSLCFLQARAGDPTLRALVRAARAAWPRAD